MKYIIEVKEVHYRIVEVNLPEDATRERIVEEANKETDVYLDLEYSHTLDENIWNVRDENGNYID